jgi:hypothetical protein
MTFSEPVDGPGGPSPKGVLSGPSPKGVSTNVASVR